MIAAVVGCSAIALAGCEEQSYPTPSVEQAPPPAPPPPAPLMGAPAQPPPYSPCAENPCGGPSAPPAQPMMAPRVIASTPVPNPPEVERAHHRRHSRFWVSAEAQTASERPHAATRHSDTRWHVVAPAAAPAAHPAAVARNVVAAPVEAHHAHHPAPAPAPTSQAKAPAAVASHKAPAAPTVASTAPEAGAAAVVGNITDNATGAPSGAGADHYNSLQSALSNVIGIDAALATPDHFQANQTIDVTLTLPGSFAQQVHEEAGKVGLADAAESVNVDARLTGTGFTVTPDQPQAQPLLLGQPTVFHWKVTPTSAAVGALRADLTADLLTVGHALPLGSVQSQAAINPIHLSGRLIGVGLLILVLVVVAAWLFSRSGAGPAFRRKDI